MFGRFKDLSKNADIAVALCLVIVLGIMIVPIAPWAMDLFIAVSLAASIVILLLSVYIKKPLDFSTFPAVLLVVTRRLNKEYSY
jgi:flagellar biosynthesis protein FlhA